MDIRDARRLFPAAADRAYFNTAAVGLASRRLADTYHAFIDEWTTVGLDFTLGEQAAGRARSAVARLMGADPSDVALIPSVSSAAGLVAAQFGPADPGDNIVIGEREYSSNHFPWRQLARKGYDVRQVPFRGGGLHPDDVHERVDAGTRLVAFSGVQAATGHRSDIASISGIAREVGAIVFVDGSQLVGALPIAEDLRRVDVLVAPDHKFLLNAGRGMGFCYLSSTVQARFTPINAGWRAGLATRLRAALSAVGWAPVELPEPNRSTIVSVPIGTSEPSRLLGVLSERGIICSARDGNLRVAVHFYNDEDDIERLVTTLSSAGSAR